jgi:hypothetical protein
MCLQAWRCAVVAILVDGVIDIYLLVLTPRVMHVYSEDDIGTSARVIWVLVLVSFLLHTAGCAWVIHNTMNLHRLLFPVSSGAVITSGAATLVG